MGGAIAARKRQRSQLQYALFYSLKLFHVNAIGKLILMASWNVLVEPTEDGQTMATVVELPSFQVTADNRQMALDKVQQLLTERLANAEMISISAPSPKNENPWLKFGGIFKDDSDFEEILQEMQAEREGLS